MGREKEEGVRGEEQGRGEGTLIPKTVSWKQRKNNLRDTVPW